MSNITVLQEVFDRAGRLQDVWEARIEGAAHLVTEVRLRFEAVNLVVSADGDFDTVVLRLGDFADDPDAVQVCASNIAPWSSVVGLGMGWGWELTNHQGYSDGVRFDFTDPALGRSVEVDLIVAASTLQLCVCAPVTRLPNKPLQPTSDG